MHAQMSTSLIVGNCWVDLGANCSDLKCKLPTFLLLLGSTSGGSSSFVRCY